MPRPNRFNAIAGAAKAAEALGDKAKAEGYYRRLAALGVEMLIEQSSSPRANSCRRIEPRTGQPTWPRQPASPPRLRKAQRMTMMPAGRKRQMAVLKDGTHSMLRLIIVLAIELAAAADSVTAAAAQAIRSGRSSSSCRSAPPPASTSPPGCSAKLAALGQAGGGRDRPGGDGLVAINAFISANDDHTLLFVPASTYTAHPYAHESCPTMRSATCCRSPTSPS